MYYRRKIILSMLELFGNELDKIRLQKLLFLFCNKQQKPDYEFIPYKYGCYSYSANADLSTMVKRGILSETDDNFNKVIVDNYKNVLKPDDKLILNEIKKNYANMDAQSLMKHTYINFPYWAINSLKAKEILNKEQYENVLLNKNRNVDPILFTIGYEGVSLELYLNKLIKNNVKVLIDVRNNPLSMKYGFSKSMLQKYCNSVGINYMHIPEVGIKADKRKALNTQTDYDNLFENYKQEDLKNTIPFQEKIVSLLKDKKRIALTCFEANICQCHRKPLAEAIKNLGNFNYSIKHI